VGLGRLVRPGASLIIAARFEEADGNLTLVVPGGIGADLRMHGRIAGSPIEDGSGHVRVREALRVLVANRWVEVEQTVAELRIRHGERARKLHGPTENWRPRAL
jgi:hypothetical protein